MRSEDKNCRNPCDTVAWRIPSDNKPVSGLRVQRIPSLFSFTAGASFPEGEEAERVLKDSPTHSPRKLRDARERWQEVRNNLGRAPDIAQEQERERSSLTMRQRMFQHSPGGQGKGTENKRRLQEEWTEDTHEAAIAEDPLSFTGISFPFAKRIKTHEDDALNQLAVSELSTSPASKVKEVRVRTQTYASRVRGQTAAKSAVTAAPAGSGVGARTTATDAAEEVTTGGDQSPPVTSSDDSAHTHESTF